MATGFDPADEASAILEMIGTDSRLVVGEHLLVAYNGRSTVSVRDGSLEVGGEFRPFGGGTGTINFSNARVSVGDRVRFGQFAGGKGVLTLDDNTDLTSGRIDPVGEAEETDAKVVLKGGSTWFARSGGGNTRIGNSRGASGAIVIEEGSRLRIEGHSLFFIGAARGAVGEISVGGVGSTLEGKALSIFVGGREQGARGEGSLMVADRGGIHIGDDLVIWGNGSLNVNGGRIYARRLRFSDEGAVLNVTLGDCDGPFLGIVEDIHLGHRARLRVRVAGGRKIVPGDEFVLARYGGSLSGGFGGMHDGNLLRAGDHEFEINYGTGTDDSISLVAIEPQNS